MEYKSIKFEKKDIDKGSRTAVIAFATYNNIDRDGDVIRRGAFTKSWNEAKSDIRFFLNHDKTQVPGRPLEFWEDDTHAYAKAYLGTHTLGEDTLKMMDEGIITDSSFGFLPIPERTGKIPGKGREFKGVIQKEFSVLTHWGANPLSGVKEVRKDFSSELTEIKEHLDIMEKFCRNTTATDQSIQLVLKQIDITKEIISKYDTADTHLAGAQSASSKDDNSLLKKLLLFKAKI